MTPQENLLLDVCVYMVKNICNGETPKSHKSQGYKKTNINYENKRNFILQQLKPSDSATFALFLVQYQSYNLVSKNQ